MTTIEDILTDRATRGLTSILDELYAHAYLAGARIPCEVVHSEVMRALIEIVEQRHYERELLPRGWVDPPLLRGDDIPNWLLRQKQQADVLESPPVEGWPV